MRVAMVTHYPVNPDIVPGGVTAVANYLADGLARRKDVELHIFCCHSGIQESRTEVRGEIIVHFLRGDDRFSLLTKWRPQRRRLTNEIEKIEPDIIHAQGLGLPAGPGLESELPSIVTVHGLIWKEATIGAYSTADWIRWRARGSIAYKQLLKSKNVIVISPYVSRMMPEDGRSREFVIYNPVSDDIFSIQNSPETPHILVVGGVRPRKDPMTSLKVMHKVLEAVPDATMDILGPGGDSAYETKVADELERLGLQERVRLLGLVSGQELQNQYKRSSILLMPSLEETAPMAIAESYAVGIPAVGSDAGGIPDMIEQGTTGFVRPMHDADGMAEDVISILRNNELRSKLSVNARRVAQEKYQLDAIAAQTVDAYRQVISEKTAKS